MVIRASSKKVILFACWFNCSVLFSNYNADKRLYLASIKSLSGFVSYVFLTDIKIFLGTPTLCRKNPVLSENEDANENQMLDDHEDEFFSDDRSLDCASSSTSVVSMHSKFTMDGYGWVF